MVEIEPVEEVEMSETPIPQSEERFLDADEIESLSKMAKRPSVKIQLQALVQRMKRDGNALKRVEESSKKADSVDDSANATATDPIKDETVDKVIATPSLKSATPTISSSSSNVPISSSVKYQPIDRFLFDAGSYNSPTVTLYINSPEMKNIGSLPKDQINCKFTNSSFDLTIENFNGVNYRLFKDNLDKDIDPEKSACKVKANKIIIKLAKVKSEYGSYDSWTDLTSKKTKESKAQAAKDPSASIMGMMKEMYDNGDDNMKKMIGETMLKQREGRLGKDMDGPGGMGGLGGMGDMNLDM